ncbi:MAG: D-aminoacyl-tRNA deacylase [Acidobacteriota bacterium]
MRVILQRVREASVTVDGAVVAAIGPGILALVGFGREDGPDFVASPPCRMVLDKMLDLRIFPADGSAFEHSLRDCGGELLLVSQFTLYASCRKGRRPSFSDAAPPEAARALYAALVRRAQESLPGRVRSGIFGADMEVRLNNWGPVTISLNSVDFGGAT